MSAKNNAALVRLNKKGKHLEVGLKKGLEKGLDAFHELFQDTRLRGRPGLRVRTGNLLQSFHHRVTGSTLDTITGRYGTNSSYAAKHEFGGKITPKKAKFLTIPLDDNKTAAGVARMDASTVIDTFAYHAFLPAANPPNLVLVAGQDEASAKPMFVLVKSVTIPKRLHLFKTWRHFAKQEGGLKKHIKIAVAGALSK